MRYVGLCLALVIVAGCSEDPLSSIENGLVIRSSQPSAQPGDTISIRLVNLSGHALQENLCQLALEMKRGTAWTPVYDEPGPAGTCPAFLRGFPNGRAIERRLVLPSTLLAGEYRVTFHGLYVEDGPVLSEESRASQSFTVTP
jgi:hypothetical protein